MDTAGLRQQLIDMIRTERRRLEPELPSLRPRLEPLEDIRCVAFDVYGTLMVSAAGELAAGSGDAGLVDSPRRTGCSAVAAALGMSGDTAPARLESALGAAIGAAHEAGRRAGRQQPEVDIRDIWEAIAALEAPEWNGDPTPAELALTYELHANPVDLMPGARTTLAQLRASGYMLAIVSNAQFYTPLSLEALMDSPLPVLVPGPHVWSWELGAAKPDPMVFEALIGKLAARGITPAQTLYVGNDMLNDVMAASHAGLRTALFAGDRRSLRLREGDARLSGVEPDAVVTRLDQIPALCAPRKADPL